MKTADKTSINTSIQRIQNKLDSITVDKILSKSSNLEILSRNQILFDSRFISDEIDKTLFEMILNSALKVEKTFPGSLKFFFNDFFSYYSKNFFSFVKSAGSRHPNLSDVYELLNQFDLSLSERNIISTALEMAGFGGKISVEKTSNNSISIEKTNGYVFNISCPIINNRLLLTNAFIVPIDGFIESVSEINRILETAHADKQKIILLVRGMHNDVLNTLKVNFDRGSLQVIPFIVNFDVDGINLLKDIAVVSQNDIVSTHKGDLISSTDVSLFKQVEKVIIDNKTLTIFNKSSKSFVDKHITFLKNKRNECESEAMTEVFTKRIKGLFSSHVIIRLPDDEYSKIISEKFDTVLRKINHLLNYGSFDVRNHPLYHSIIIECVNSIKNLGMVLLDG